MMLFYVLSTTFCAPLSIFVSSYLMVFLLPHVEMSKQKTTSCSHLYRRQNISQSCLGFIKTRHKKVLLSYISDLRFRVDYSDNASDLMQCGVFNCGLIVYGRVIFNVAVLNSPNLATGEVVEPRFYDHLCGTHLATAIIPQ